MYPSEFLWTPLIYTHKNTRGHTYTHTNTHTHTRTHTHTHTLPHMHTLTHSRTHTLSHAHIHISTLAVNLVTLAAKVWPQQCQEHPPPKQVSTERVVLMLLVLLLLMLLHQSKGGSTEEILSPFISLLSQRLMLIRTLWSGHQIPQKQAGPSCVLVQSWTVRVSAAVVWNTSGGGKRGVKRVAAGRCACRRQLAEICRRQGCMCMCMCVRDCHPAKIVRQYYSTT
jgi:hypothetical protein